MSAHCSGRHCGIVSGDSRAIVGLAQTGRRLTPVLLALRQREEAQQVAAEAVRLMKSLAAREPTAWRSVLTIYKQMDRDGQLRASERPDVTGLQQRVDKCGP